MSHNTALPLELTRLRDQILIIESPFNQNYLLNTPRNYSPLILSHIEIALSSTDLLKYYQIIYMNINTPSIYLGLSGINSLYLPLIFSTCSMQILSELFGHNPCRPRDVCDEIRGVHFLPIFAVPGLSYAKEQIPCYELILYNILGLPLYSSNTLITLFISYVMVSCHKQLTLLLSISFTWSILLGLFIPYFYVPCQDLDLILDFIHFLLLIVWGTHHAKAGLSIK